jgi:hypothetical protein
VTRRTRWADRDDDDREAASSEAPDPDFTDTRPWIAAGASVWGTPERGDLEDVGEVLDGVLGRFAGAAGSTLQQISAVWEVATGPDWNAARPSRVVDDTLVVDVPDGMIASRLQFDVSRVIAALRPVAGGRVKRVRFRVARR